MTNERNRKPVSIAVLAETAISLALDEVRAKYPDAIPAHAELVVKSTPRVSKTSGSTA